MNIIIAKNIYVRFCSPVYGVEYRLHFLPKNAHTTKCENPMIRLLAKHITKFPMNPELNEKI